MHWRCVATSSDEFLMKNTNAVYHKLSGTATFVTVVTRYEPWQPFSHLSSLFFSTSTGSI
jgi:hypothetical protein